MSIAYGGGNIATGLGSFGGGQVTGGQVVGGQSPRGAFDQVGLIANTYPSPFAYGQLPPGVIAQGGYLYGPGIPYGTLAPTPPKATAPPAAPAPKPKAAPQPVAPTPVAAPTAGPPPSPVSISPSPAAPEEAPPAPSGPSNLGVAPVAPTAGAPPSGVPTAPAPTAFKGAPPPTAPSLVSTPGALNSLLGPSDVPFQAQKTPTSGNPLLDALDSKSAGPQGPRQSLPRVNAQPFGSNANPYAPDAAKQRWLRSNGLV